MRKGWNESLNLAHPKEVNNLERAKNEAQKGRVHSTCRMQVLIQVWRWLEDWPDSLLREQYTEELSPSPSPDAITIK